jgi:hypothetical protein
VHCASSDVHGSSGLGLSVNFLIYGYTGSCLSGMAFEIRLDEADTIACYSGRERASSRRSWAVPAKGPPLRDLRKDEPVPVSVKTGCLRKRVAAAIRVDLNAQPECCAQSPRLRAYERSFRPKIRDGRKRRHARRTSNMV